jgi:uncharacterized membrane protein (UPF0127 family)
MTITINDNIFKCKVCVSPQSIQEGMKNKNFNMSFNGMFFMMPNRGRQNFWMYECIVPLDIIMIDNNIITKIHHDCMPCGIEDACEEYSGFGDQVLEVAGGTCRELGINQGDQINTKIN